MDKNYTREERYDAERIEKLAYHYDLVECDHKKATYVYQNNIESIAIKFIDFNKVLTKDIILNINNLSNNYYVIANELTEEVKDIANNNKINLWKIYKEEMQINA